MKAPIMINRRDTLSHGVRIAALMATAGLLPAAVHAAWSKDAFDAKTLADTVKALGGTAPVQSTEVTITGPDIAENGAVVPVGASTALAGVKRLALLVEKLRPQDALEVVRALVRVRDEKELAPTLAGVMRGVVERRADEAKRGGSD